MTDSDPKADLHEYLRSARDAVLWKLEGLSEYDVRRPLVPTGTNLLGLVKHLATVEWGHFGAAFGRPFAERLPWVDEDTEPNADMWATADESRDGIVDLYRRIAAHSDTVIEALPLDAVGHVPWWPRGVQRGHPAPHPRAHDRRGAPPRRARRHRPGADRRVGRAGERRRRHPG